MTIYSPSQDNEKILVKIVRSLPPNRAKELVNFARFLEAQSLTKEILENEMEAEVQADNERWDKLLASDKSQNLLNQLAREAKLEHRAGNTKPMSFNDSEGMMNIFSFSNIFE